MLYHPENGGKGIENSFKKPKIDGVKSGVFIIFD